MNVCDALLDVLAGYGVRYIFGIPGDAINELTEAIRKQDKIKFIHVMHEESGAFAASAQAKLSGGLAVCAGTAGPGAIHLLNGLYDAKMDGAPVLAITGQVETALMGTSYQQEVNLLSLFEDVTVFNQTITTAAQMPELATLACQTAISKKGIAHINIPGNISNQKVEDYLAKKQIINNNIRTVPFREDLNGAAMVINNAKKPCILAGIGAREAVAEMIKLAETIQAPIIKALRGKDILPDLHPLTLGGIGLLGTEPSFDAIKNCDLLISIGTDFPYHDFYPDNKIPTIQIDNRIQQIGRRQVVTNPLVGDARLTLSELLPLVEHNGDGSFLAWCQNNMQKWMAEQNNIETSHDIPIHPQVLARKVSDLAKDDAIICCDTGAVTVWGARNFRIKGTQRFTLSGDLASMAFGLPAAIGAQLLFPEKQVIALCGDGGFAMLMCDFATAVKYRLPVKIFIFNNGKLGLIQMEQEARSGNPEYETELHNPDYAQFARICGGQGYTATDPTELDAAIRSALKSDGPCIINVFVNPAEITWPPKITLNEAVNYVKARVKEYFMKG
jgi:thiamine pyrophosphate-dependent acetolactate synthase large subunit-like protein